MELTAYGVFIFGLFSFGFGWLAGACMKAGSDGGGDPEEEARLDRLDNLECGHSRDCEWKCGAASERRARAEERIHE